MRFNIFQWRSLKTRVTLFTLAIFLISIWSLGFYASRMLREDMQRLLSEQQFSTVSLMASEVNQQLDDRLRALESVAAKMSPSLLGKTAALQAYLEDRTVLMVQFNGGIAALGPDGTVIADVPISAGRIGVNYMDVDVASAAALREGKPTIGRPVMGRQLRAPVFVMVVPIRDTQDRVIGALAGVINLGKPNFLDKISKNSYGKTGGYLLVAPQYRLVVTASDKSRIMEALPAPGINPVLDRFIQGYEGSDIFISPIGVEVLASVRGVPVAGWYVALALPTAEAFAPIRAMQLRMLLATIFLTLLAGVLVWLMLRRQFSPMLAAARALATLSDTKLPAQPFPITRRDEIGELLGGLNQLLETLAHREEVLRETKRFLRESQNIAGLGSFVLDIRTGFWKSSDVFDRVFGIDAAYERSLEGWVARIHPRDRAMLADYLATEILGKGQTFDKEHRIIRHGDQAERWVYELGKLEFDAQGRPLKLHGTVQDITERKQAEQYEQFRSHTLELLAGGEPLPSMLETIARGVEQLYPEMLCTILLLDSEGRPFNRGVASTAAMSASWSQTIRGSSGQELGIFAIYAQKAHTPASSDIALFEQSAHLASIAIEKSLVAEKLYDSEERFRTLVEWSPEPILVHRLGKILYVNSAAIKMFGATQAPDLIGKSTSELIHPDFLEVQMTRMENIIKNIAIAPMIESRFLKLDGTPIDVEVQGTSIVYDGEPAIHVCVRDITARKQAEENLHLAASVFTHAREGIMITSADGSIIDVNDAFTLITGYSRDEVLGKNPRLLCSGRQEKEFYVAMWRELIEKGHWYGEVWNRRKNGEVYAEMQTISAVRDTEGKTRQYVALFSDITVIKEQQRELEHIAQYDALTRLPNRLLLADRLQQGMAQAQRRGNLLAVAFIDLDGFKAVNDHHGHEAGDHLLLTVATRMKQGLRESDTLARLGGDEFVAVLVDLENEADSVPMLNRLLTAAAQPVVFRDFVLQVSASLGVTFYPQAQDVAADQMLRQADQAMYRAKLTGKNRYHVFGAE